MTDSGIEGQIRNKATEWLDDLREIMTMDSTTKGEIIRFCTQFVTEVVEPIVRQTEATRNKQLQKIQTILKKEMPWQAEVPCRKIEKILEELLKP